MTTPAYRAMQLHYETLAGQLALAHTHVGVALNMIDEKRDPTIEYRTPLDDLHETVENAYDEIEDALYEVRTWLNEINLPYGPHSEAKEWTTPTVCPACGTTLSPRSTTPPSTTSSPTSDEPSTSLSH